jgi:carbonic anhydrase/acetyltransferase-like protein (isoleucine patch superfamily)
MSRLRQQLERYLTKRPVVGQSVFIAPGAVVLGDVTLGDHASVWYNAVLRGDINCIGIGCYTNIQDNAMVHLADEDPCLVGEYVTVGHGAILHACTIGDETLVGMGATVLDGAVVGRQCIIGANALITGHARIPAGSLVLGSPATVRRALSPKEREQLKPQALKYAEYAAYCCAHPPSLWPASRTRRLDRPWSSGRPGKP